MKKTTRGFSLLSLCFLLLQIALSGFSFVTPITETLADDTGLCSAPVDMVMILDRSGSMDYTSRCDWWQLVCKNKPSCSLGYEWIQNTDYNQTEAWCRARNQSAPHQAVYLAINPKKIISAQNSANDFLSLMGATDQSALVSFATTATLDKLLSSNHAATKTAVSSLTPSGATNIGDAIKLGVQELKSARSNPQANRAMILLTDGMANKPSGPGSGEYQPDVDYALAQADLAATYGFKIFTIGLGENGEINEVMLQHIATATGATYYHSPTNSDLQSIYNSIRSKLCQYGSLSGCQWHDLNKDGVWQTTETERLPNVVINLSKDGQLVASQSTSADESSDQYGCYQFSGLVPGTYSVSETLPSGWLQTYPASGTHANLVIDWNTHVEQLHFGNYQPRCGNQIIDAGEDCEISVNGAALCATDCTFKVQCTDHDADGYALEGAACGPVDCADDNAALNPGASESCDGLDNNCDGQIDETFGDLNSACHVGQGLCAKSGQKICAADGLGTVCSAVAGEPALEVCDGSLDENCDGTVDENCECLDGTTRSCGSDLSVGLCHPGLQTCLQGVWGACVGSVTPTDETCDGLDNDCDSETDELFLNLNAQCLAGVGKCQASGYYVCASSLTGTVCNALPGTPDEQETCGNGVDDNCDGAVDEGCPLCGDGLINQTSEQCDGLAGVGEHQSCSATCTLINLPYCGDNLKNNNEECDGTAGLITGWHCTDACTLAADQSGPNYGSLKIYKYLDWDGDLNTSADQNLSTTTDWSFTASLDSASYAATTTAGLATLNNLLAGTYLITEQPQAGWYLLGPNSTNSSVAVVAGQSSTINFYNAAYASLAGYVYEDGDGATTTLGDLIGQPGWLVNLFDATATTTPLATTTSDATGYFEFKNLLPGNYQLTEILPTDWQQLSAPDTPLALTPGLNSLHNNFINYYPGGTGGDPGYCGDNLKNGTEQCDGSDGVTSGYVCNNNCQLEARSSGGGGTGGSYGVCGNGIKEGLEFCDDAAGVPPGYICNATCSAYAPVPTLSQSNPDTTALAPSAPSDTTRPVTVNPIQVASSQPTVSTRTNISGDTTQQTTPEIASNANSTANPPAILGATACPHCPWWLWILLAILHLAIVIIYILAVTPEKEIKINDPKNPSPQTTKIIKGSWWWLGPVALLVVIIFCLLHFLCQLDWPVLAALLGSFYLLLTAYYLLLRTGRGAFGQLTTLVFLTLIPLAGYLYCSWFNHWLWLLVLALYIISLVCYWASALRLTTHRYFFWSWFVLAVSVLMVVMEWLVEHCQCW